MIIKKRDFKNKKKVTNDNFILKDCQLYIYNIVKI